MSKVGGAFDLASGVGGKMEKRDVLSAIEKYEKYHGYYGGDEEERKANYTDMVNKYYDLVTSFYEYGWGESFHFAQRWKGESLQESIKRHEHFLSLQLGLKPGQKVGGAFDLTSGVGGKMEKRDVLSAVEKHDVDKAPDISLNLGSRCYSMHACHHGFGLNASPLPRSSLTDCPHLISTWSHLSSASLGNIQITLLFGCSGVNASRTLVIIGITNSLRSHCLVSSLAIAPSIKVTSVSTLLLAGFISPAMLSSMRRSYHLQSLIDSMMMSGALSDVSLDTLCLSSVVIVELQTNLSVSLTF